MSTVTQTRRRNGARLLALALALALPTPQVAQEESEPEPEETRDVGLVERAGRSLAQFDVSVSGPEDAVRGLTREDFELVVKSRVMTEFLVDDLCAPPPVESAGEETEPTAAASGPAPAPALPLRPAVSYLFYFDQHHLLPGGRQEAIETTRDLIPQLVQGGNRAMIISAGQEMAVLADLTVDADGLLAALDRLENDRRQWDQYPMQEDFRVREVLRVLRQDGDTARAKSLARIYQREEKWNTERALHLFEIALGRLADVDPPKAVIYFSDTMRSNPGAHYMSFFSADREAIQQDPQLSAMEMDAFSSGNAFQRVLDEAGAHGIRLYTIQAEGLVAQSMVTSTRGQTARGANLANQTLANKRRMIDAQDSLVGMAAETGGESFLHGVRAARIADRIVSDLSCLYLISFDPTGFPEDNGLSLLVRVNRPKVRVHARGQIVLQSDSERLTSRLLAAFATPERDDRGPGLRGVVVPTGYADGKFSALVQMSAPASPLPDATWEMGLSLVSRGKVRENASASVNVSAPGVPVVFESEMSFKPGPYELVMVARESTGKHVHSTRIDGDWPDPDDAPITVGPIVALQPGDGFFLRGDESRTGGALARGPSELLRVDRPTALVGLVCRSRSRRKFLSVERTLSGTDAVNFKPMDLEFGEERCAQIRDLVPANVMTPGAFSYALRVFEDTTEMAVSKLDFMATGDDEARAQDASVDSAGAGR